VDVVLLYSHDFAAFLYHRFQSTASTQAAFGWILGLLQPLISYRRDDIWHFEFLLFRDIDGDVITISLPMLLSRGVLWQL
jgi:hypothetical protein